MKSTSRNITDHFTIDDISHSDTAIKNNIDNTMPDIYFNNALGVSKYILEEVRLHYNIPFSPLSWYRGDKLNSLLGGAENSQHKVASAVDFVIPGYNNLEVATWIHDNLDFDQLILENYHGNSNDGWIHCSWVNYGNRNESLRFDGHVYLKELQ